jgi:hypothetical protein
VRAAVLSRLIRANTAHAQHAVEERSGANALGAHALLLFSIEHTREPFGLSTATRLEGELEDGEDLHQMLTEITAHAAAQIAAATKSKTWWEPRAPFTGLTTTSETLTTEHRYIGLGISTLDRPEISWRDARRSLRREDALYVPGQAMLYLVDGTAVHVITRAPMMGPTAGQHLIIADRDVNSHHRVQHDNSLTSGGPGASRWPLWEQLHRLNDVLVNA